LAVLLSLIISALGMIAGSVAQYPRLLSQPGARTFVWEPACALVAYAVSIILIGMARRAYWFPIQRNAIRFGILTGCLEILNLVIENGFFFGLRSAAVQIGFMLSIFVLWGVAAWRVAGELKSICAGLFAAVTTAGICMLIGVPAGFMMEFFLAPPSSAYVSTWAEFRRSGWTDAHAFGIANTLDSGFTHLVMAPIVALLFGVLGALLARFTPSKVRLIAR
jgi:hypothetical protein